MSLALYQSTEYKEWLKKQQKKEKKNEK